MAHDEELFAERRRLEDRAAAHDRGSLELSVELEHRAQVKLSAAWTDAVRPLGPSVLNALSKRISERGQRSIGVSLSPLDMSFGLGTSNDVLLSLIEAEHEALASYATDREVDPKTVDSDFRPLPPIAAAMAAPDGFLVDVNRILESHDVALRLTASSQLVPVTSFELHDDVVTPTLRLLHADPRFTAAEMAYLKALQEIRNGDAGDAITDAATALQSALTVLGCSGATLGALLSSARSRGLLRGNDTPLAEAIAASGRWVAAQRNDGEAHYGNPDSTLSDAWMVVHVVGALIVRLVDTTRENGFDRTE